MWFNPRSVSSDDFQKKLYPYGSRLWLNIKEIHNAGSWEIASFFLLIFFMLTVFVFALLACAGCFNKRRRSLKFCKMWFNPRSMPSDDFQKKLYPYGSRLWLNIKEIHNAGSWEIASFFLLIFFMLTVFVFALLACAGCFNKRRRSLKVSKYSNGSAPAAAATFNKSRTL